MNHFVLSTLTFTFLNLFQAKAQTVTKTDTINATPLSITMDKKISNLIDHLENRCTEANSRLKQNTNPTQEQTITKIPDRELTTAEICRQTPKILGFKIQLAIVKSNKEANEVKTYFRRRFPSIKTEIDASLRPNYKVLAGSYFTKQSAKVDLSKIRAFFKSATPVKYRIYCVEAK